MPRPSNPTTPEAKALTEAIEAAESSKAKIADALNVTPGLVSQYASGHRPVPWDRAETIALPLRIDPESISSEYRRIVAHFGPSKLLRLTPSMISSTIETMRVATNRVEGEPVDPSDDPVLFIETLRLKILESEMGDEQRISPAVGPGRRVAGPAGKAEAGAQDAAAGRRKRKAARSR